MAASQNLKQGSEQNGSFPRLTLHWQSEWETGKPGRLWQWSRQELNEHQQGSREQGDRRGTNAKLGSFISSSPEKNYPVC